jgi:hypothetical protein
MYFYLLLDDHPRHAQRNLKVQVSWPGKQERDPILPFKVRRLGEISYKLQVSANEEIALGGQLKCKELYVYAF